LSYKGRKKEGGDREREGGGEKEQCHPSWRQLAEISLVVY